MPKMKMYASFDAYEADQAPHNRAIIRALRAFVKRVTPGLTEAVKWGNGCWIGPNGPVAYVYSAPDHVQFGFFRGSALKDPRGILVGKGQYVRHVNVHDLAGFDERACATLLRQATRTV